MTADDPDHLLPEPRARVRIDAMPEAACWRCRTSRRLKANVLFFDRKSGSDTAWTKGLWIYELRTNEHFTLKTKPLCRADLDDFVESYRRGQRGKREETERFHRFTYDELVGRDKANLDIFWLRNAKTPTTSPPQASSPRRSFKTSKPTSPNSPNSPNPSGASASRWRPADEAGPARPLRRPAR